MNTINEQKILRLVDDWYFEKLWRQLKLWRKVVVGILDKDIETSAISHYFDFGNSVSAFHYREYREFWPYGKFQGRLLPWITCHTGDLMPTW